MKVGLVSPYDFASPGGVTDHVRYLAKELTNLGHQAQIFAPSSRTHAESDGTTFHRLGTPIASPRAPSSVATSRTFRCASSPTASTPRFTDRGCRRSGTCVTTR